MTARIGAVRLGPSTTGFETRIGYIKQSPLIIWPIGIAGWNWSHAGRNLRTFRHVLTRGQNRAGRDRQRDFAPKRTADCAVGGFVEFGANIVQVDQKVLVLPAVCRSSMAHGAAIRAICGRRPNGSRRNSPLRGVKSVPLVQVVDRLAISEIIADAAETAAQYAGRRSGRISILCRIVAAET